MGILRHFDHKDARHWLSAAPFDFAHLKDEEKLNFLFIFNALSFRYWGEPKWAVLYRGRIYDGAWGMIVALGKAIEAGKPIFDANYRAKISRAEFADILSGAVEIPLFDERLMIMQQNSEILLRKYDGNFAKVNVVPLV